jgi:hypothetical protein
MNDGQESPKDKKAREVRVDSQQLAHLLTPQALADRLAVPQSWIREKTRERARVRDKDPLPVVRLGKYVRFDWAAVQAWLGRQKS